MSDNAVSVDKDKDVEKVRTEYLTRDYITSYNFINDTVKSLENKNTFDKNVLELFYYLYDQFAKHTSNFVDVKVTIGNVNSKKLILMLFNINRYYNYLTVEQQNDFNEVIESWMQYSKAVSYIKNSYNDERFYKNVMDHKEYINNNFVKIIKTLNDECNAIALSQVMNNPILEIVKKKEYNNE